MTDRAPTEAAEIEADYERRCSFDQVALDTALHLAEVFKSKPERLRVTKAQIAITELLMAETAHSSFPVRDAEPEILKAEGQGDQVGRTGGVTPPTGSLTLATPEPSADMAEVERLAAAFGTAERNVGSHRDDRFLPPEHDAELARDALLAAHRTIASKLAAAEAEIERLRGEVGEATDLLHTIHEFAHDRSTGPVVEDHLWEIRNMAVSLITTGAGHE